MDELETSSDLPRTSGKGNPFRSPVTDENLGDEISLRWSQREYHRHIIDLQRAEILKVDAVLGEMLYRLKKKLSRVGRGGEWSAWLREHNIVRNSADRMILDFAEFFGLGDELPHRIAAEPRQNQICQAAYRISDRLEGMLQTPHARMDFLRCLADLFELSVDLEDGSVRLSLPSPGADGRTAE